MKQRIGSIGAYCYIWLMVGFFLGTLLLVGPVRLLTEGLRVRGWSDTAENLVMIGVIGTYVLVSAAISWWLYRRVAACRTTTTRLAIPITVTIAAAACLWAWMNPTLLAGFAGGAGGDVKMAGGPEFVFGPYPDRPRLEQLKKDGYTAVVSLQHPAVLPFEPPGIAEEQRATSEIGLTFIHAPMLPWVSANDESLQKIKALAHGGPGKYYVHCGLGRDRANLVKRMLEREGTHTVAAEGFVAAGTFASRVAEGNQPYERGAIREIEKDVWLIPYPNKHELFGNLLSGQVRHVVLLLDASSAEQHAWIDESTKLFGEFGVPYSIHPLKADDEGRARALAEKIRTLPRPVAVVVPFTPPREHTEVADVFLRGWSGGAGRPTRLTRPTRPNWPRTSPPQLLVDAVPGSDVGPVGTCDMR